MISVLNLDLSAGERYRLQNYMSWDEQTVLQWLGDIGLDKFVTNFSEHNITGDILTDLRHEHLKEMGIELVGDRARFLILIRRLDATRLKLLSQSPKNSKSSVAKEPSVDLSAAPFSSEASLRQLMISTSPSTLRKGDNLFQGDRALGSAPQPSQALSAVPSTIVNPATPKSALSHAKTLPLNQLRSQISSPSIRTPNTPSQRMTGLKSADDSNNNKQFNSGSLEFNMGSGSWDVMNGSNRSREPSSGSISSKKKVIRVVGDDGQSRIVDVTGVFDARDVYTRILQKFSAFRDRANLSNDFLTKEMEKLNFFISDSGGARMLKDEELVLFGAPAIDSNNSDVNRIPQLIMRRKHSTSQQSGKKPANMNRKLAKLEKIFGEKITTGSSRSGSVSEPSTPKSSSHHFGTQANTLREETRSILHSPAVGKLRNFFGERPPSEMITGNLAQFFPSVKNSSTTQLAASVVRDGETEGKDANEFEELTENTDEDLDLVATSAPLEQNSSHSFPRPSVVPMSAPIVAPSYSLPRNPPPNTNPFQLLSNRKSTSKSIKYFKGKLIGSGSFGNVYHGLNALTGELMAIKQVILPKEDDENGTRNEKIQNRRRAMVDALKREILLLKEVEHPNIVRYLGSESTKEYLNIFLEYVSGGSLTTMLSGYGALGQELVVVFTSQILSGLMYLHDKNIIHRDIKGANILVESSGVCKIADFGISKKIANPTNPELGRASVISVMATTTQNRASSLQGSVYWMAPEVVKHYNYTKKADIWSLGCLVIEMFTGTHPWNGMEQMQAMFKIGSFETPPYPTEPISSDARNFLDKCFELDHRRRYSAAQMAAMPFVFTSDDEDKSLNSSLVASTDTLDKVPE